MEPVVSVMTVFWVVRKSKVFLVSNGSAWGRSRRKGATMMAVVTVKCKVFLALLQAVSGASFTMALSAPYHCSPPWVVPVSWLTSIVNLMKSKTWSFGYAHGGILSQLGG